jgi:hypothetical protein
MDLLSIGAAVVWVDFFTIVLLKYFKIGGSIDTWYNKFGIVAVLCDCLILVITILTAQLFFPQYSLLVTAVVIQVIHDILFYLLVIIPLPVGTNAGIDLFKSYASEQSFNIYFADVTMVAATVLLAKQLNGKYVPFIGLLGAYALTYIIYTK